MQFSLANNFQTDKKNSIIKSINLKYFDTLLENSIVSKSDLEGNITYINKNFEKITGFSAEEALGNNHSILRHPDMSDSAFKELWDTIKSGQVYRSRLLNKKKDGSDFWAETTIIPLIDNSLGEIIEYIAIRNDITEFLHMKRAINKQNIKEEENRKIAAAKDSFLILFTHELKTPLNAIINFSKYLLKHVAGGTIDNIALKKRENLLTQIELSAEKMLIDITHLLDLSKLKANKLHYNIKNINLISILKEVIGEHGGIIDEYKTDISFDLCCNSCIAKSDPYRVKQILANVLSNAIKYSHGKVKVSIVCNKEFNHIVVADNGDGISNVKGAFELFEQTEGNIETREQKGTGIGLYFVKLLCEDLKIKYFIEKSEELGGVKFNLVITK